MRKLKKVHAGSPLFTNAHCNRTQAGRLFAAGWTPERIAFEFPEVFKVVYEGGVAKLGQRYDYELADGTGRYETRYLIASETVDALLASVNPVTK